MAVNSKPGVATACKFAKELASFTAAHRLSILAVVAALSPSDYAAVVAALDGMQTTATLMSKICDLWEISTT